ncbi:DM13 domain-containing protein [Microbacterium sp.]|uniref:DM13 domain-containing protein n=1 Tax=Microbacterium sp. TaxID=51671 RepID=UPI002E352E53|nr:DM13 domain-containing protein [Microbacterium sp.]HEX5728029.1 DM13 domain-containing protein [Microbacterium sp.]
MARRTLSTRARWLWGIGAAVVIAGVVVGGLVFQPWLLFIDVRVDDEIPATAATAEPTAAPEAEVADEVTPAPLPPAAPVDLLAGTFVSHEHETTGSARVIEHPDGSRQLAIESLMTTNGPDVHVWLSAGPVLEGFGGWFTAGGHEYVDLGPIKGNLGDQLYDIPAGVDLDVFRTVDLWCVQFAVSFGAAALA